MSAWITDRVPTAKDADRYHNVYIYDREEGVIQDGWRGHKLGTPWQPITYPEPYVKPKVWAAFESYKNDSFFLAKNGTHVIGLSPFTVKQIQAMTDALNKLEDSHD